jgi:hypothetical protein
MSNLDGSRIENVIATCLLKLADHNVLIMFAGFLNPDVEYTALHPLNCTVGNGGQGLLVHLLGLAAHPTSGCVDSGDVSCFPAGFCLDPGLTESPDIARSCNRVYI